MLIFEALFLLQNNYITIFYLSLCWETGLSQYSKCAPLNILYQIKYRKKIKKFLFKLQNFSGECIPKDIKLQMTLIEYFKSDDYVVHIFQRSNTISFLNQSKGKYSGGSYK